MDKASYGGIGDPFFSISSIEFIDKWGEKELTIPFPLLDTSENPLLGGVTPIYREYRARGIRGVIGGQVEDAGGYLLWPPQPVSRTNLF